MGFRYTGVTRAFDLIAVKQRIDDDDVFNIQLALVLALDLAESF